MYEDHPFSKGNKRGGTKQRVIDKGGRINKIKFKKPICQFLVGENGQIYKRYPNEIFGFV